MPAKKIRMYSDEDYWESQKQQKGGKEKTLRGREHLKAWSVGKMGYREKAILATFSSTTKPRITKLKSSRSTEGACSLWVGLEIPYYPRKFRGGNSSIYTKKGICKRGISHRTCLNSSTPPKNPDQEQAVQAKKGKPNSSYGREFIKPDGGGSENQAFL